MKKYIYMHKFPNGKIYIGQTSNCEKRWKNGNCYDQKAMKDAVQKYGWENVEHIILEDNVDEEIADEIENYYIGKYMSYKNDIGYNTVYNGKYYPKYKYPTNKGIIKKRRTKTIKINLYEEDYEYFEKEASKYYMGIQKYIYLKLMEEKAGIKFFHLK